MHFITYQELIRYLEIPEHRDPDVQFLGYHLCHIGNGTPIPARRLHLLGNVFQAIRKRPKLRALLNFGIDGRPTYRVCALCLESDEIPYLRIQWRFIDWNYCPTHRCMLLDRCNTCNAPISSTKASLGQTYSGTPWNLSHCHHCGQSRARVSRVGLSPVLDDQELGSQAFLISAVTHGFFFIEGFSKRFDLDFLLWLRENYQWSGPGIASSGCPNKDAQVVSAIAKQMLHHLRKTNVAKPIGDAP